MPAAAQPPRQSSSQGDGTFEVMSGFSAMIADEIRDSESIEQLKLVVFNHGNDFSYVNAAAAISKAAKLPEHRSRDAGPLLTDLLKIWWQQLPEAQMRQCANVLWALARLSIADSSVWGTTLDEFLYQQQRNMLAYDGVGDIKAQEISMVIWACAMQRQGGHLMLSKSSCCCRPSPSLQF